MMWVHTRSVIALEATKLLQSFARCLCSGGRGSSGKWLRVPRHGDRDGLGWGHQLPLWHRDGGRAAV